MAKAKKVTVSSKSSEKMSCDYGTFGCCTGWCGLIHVAAGVGVGFLLVSYLGLGSNLALYGWALVALGAVGHFVKMK